MAFLSPLFLIGTLAAALPVLVHLVRRTRARRLEFPSLMFLRRIEQKTIRKRRLRNLLLLALRSAALFLLAMAFARPYFTTESHADGGANRMLTVILIDTSYSARYGGAFDRARLSARDIVNRAAEDEQIALVTFSEGYEVVRPMKADRAEAQVLIDGLQPGWGGTDYLQAVQTAEGILKDAGPGRRRVYLISDFQETGWDRGAAPVKLSPGTDLMPVDVSEPDPSNIAVVDLKAEPVVYAQKYPGRISARVSNFGAGPVEAAVDFKLNDITVERRELSLEGGGSETIEFAGFNVPDGLNRATVELSGDGFALDNKSFFTVRRTDQVRVLVIGTATRGRSESFFVEQALAAGENNKHALTVSSAGLVNPTELNPYTAIVINDASGISDGHVAGLKAFVERGGGLIIAAGKHTDGGDFNHLFAGLAPATLDEKIQPGGYALMSQIKTDHPIFSPFNRGARLNSTRVYSYHRVTPLEGALTLAALDDGSPVIIEGSAGRGKVLLIATTLDTAWNDLALTPMFLPLVRQMLDYIEGSQARSSYTVGQIFEAPADPDGSLPAVETPQGKRLDVAPGANSTSQAVQALEPGFYRLRYRDRDGYVAANLDPSESDLKKLDVEQLVASFTPGEDGAVNPKPAERVTAEEIEARQRLWLPLILLALALFVTEAALARRIRLARLVG
jgi:Mg-chelatase subunit ChlD